MIRATHFRALTHLLLRTELFDDASEYSDLILAELSTCDAIYHAVRLAVHTDVFQRLSS